MYEGMQDKIDLILDRVKDPESGLPISHLGVIERIRYNQARQELYIFANFQPHSPGCLACVGIAAALVDGIKRRLVSEFQAEFPDVAIQFGPE